jgi:MFS family permease
VGGLGALLSSYHIGRIRKPEHAIKMDEVEPQKAVEVKLAEKPKSLVRLDLLLGPFGIFMLAYLAFYAFQYFPVPLFPIAYVDKLHMTDGMIGVGTALFYGAMMAASFRLGYVSNRYGHRRVLIVSAALFPIFPLLMALAKGAVLYYLACLIGGAVNAMLSGAVFNRLMERVPADDRPAHMTLHNMALNLGMLDHYWDQFLPGCSGCSLHCISQQH